MTEYKNNENYPDPTAYEAIRRLEQEEKKRKKIKSGEWFMKWIYVASPYKGDVENNVSNAKRYALFVAKKNLVPVAPHLYLTQFLDDNIETEREVGLALGLQMLKRCRELWVFGEYISSGMCAEIEFAVRHNIPIRYFTSQCQEVTGYGDK